MPETVTLNYDLLDVFATPDRKQYRGTLAWGDTVELLEKTDKHLKINYTWLEELKDGTRKPHTDPCFIVPKARSGRTPDELILPLQENKVLRVDFLDVQQGDGSVIQTPQGKIILIDGGENQLFARYLAGRFRGTSLDNPKEIDCIVVTHGDADHFAGLAQIHESETYDKPGMEYKRLFIYPRIVYHNGLVKRPGKINGQKLDEKEMFGATVKDGGRTIITELVDDITQVPDAQMNNPFKEWKSALVTYLSRYAQSRGPTQFRRLEKGDNDAFDFLAGENIQVEVLGPIPYDNNGIHGLPFLGTPPKGAHLGHESLNAGNINFSGASASHTVNGHSVVLRLTYGNLRFLYTGDLNDQSERTLLAEHNANTLDLTADILKVPHHGSADFHPNFLKAVAPVISIVSSGDEHADKFHEHIHPRATIMGTLGRHSRTAEPLVFVTELVAFFDVEGYMRPEYHKYDAQDNLILEGGAPVLVKTMQDRGRFFAFSRKAWGSIRVRTDGNRLLIYTDSGVDGMFEAYAYDLAPNADPVPVMPNRT